ncbi:RNA polymerase I-specific transcription initiation factor RRN3 [Sphaerosporella brunnea]|uniref:RNA polymerase I-specific transcription initiation factor RRN3 n=1 Tax=Sphaerosporella brunnea TaxID=1250544 RepID=A0A5J5EX95_9PEZI|nr:RNA polymerase I-specific transcription initiation factor RRN3 [Sphaerosporella brunnea]
MFKKFVVNALDERAIGKAVRYEELRHKFQANPANVDGENKPPSSPEMQMTLSALTNVVSRLDQNCASLVQDIIAATWVGRDTLFVSAYVRFLGNLVSAHANYMGVVTKMLVRNFGMLPSSVGRLPGYPVVDRNEIYDRVHYALQYILELVPTAATSTLFPQLVAEFPHKSEKKLEHTCYLANMLRVVEYVPALRNKLLSVITDRVIKIDIEIQVDLDELDDDEGDEIEAELTGVALDDKELVTVDEESDDEEASNADEDEDVPEDSVKSLKETVDKLDSMLDLLFNYYSSYFDISDKDPSYLPASAINTFEMIHGFFNTTIMPTYRSRYTQFLLFWAAQKAPLFSDHFCVSMVERTLDNTRPVGIRQSAAAYIASYVARAKLMPQKDVRAVVRILCRWLSEFVDVRSVDCNGPDVNKFRPFYCVVQAVMYIFCFRWRELQEESEDEWGVIETSWTAGLDVMQKVITSKFNPLKICSPAVVDMFAKIANHLQFVFCFTIIEQNKRGGRGREEEMLDSYFPFDPFLLKKSRRWIDECYVVWTPVPGLEDDEDEEESDDDEADDEDVGIEGGEDDEGEDSETEGSER